MTSRRFVVIERVSSDASSRETDTSLALRVRNVRFVEVQILPSGGEDGSGVRYRGRSLGVVLSFQW